MKVRIIEANGIKEFEPVFNLEFLQQYINKVNLVPNPVHTGDYISTAGDSSTTGGYWPSSSTTISTADNIQYTDYKFNTFVNDSLAKIYLSAT